MMNTIKLNDEIIESFRCPVCKASLNKETNGFVCANEQCKTFFPIVDGIPVLINDNNSVFSIQTFLDHQNTYFKPQNKIVEFFKRLLPDTSINITAKANYKKFKELIFNNNYPKILIIGGSIIGDGLETILFDENIYFIESDISFGPRTAIILDSHDIPFKDKTFDGIIVQAVLEHVADPYCCVEEIHRVLKDDGFVYAETPFMQQVHAGKYDFTRFTHLGHRRLFRKFKEIESGTSCGPAMALIWAYSNFLLSFSKSKLTRKLITAFAKLTSFWIKYFDYYLINKPGSFDSASGYYFIGQKSDTIISDKEIINLYRGCK